MLSRGTCCLQSIYANTARDGNPSVVSAIHPRRRQKRITTATSRVRQTVGLKFDVVFSYIQLHRRWRCVRRWLRAQYTHNSAAPFFFLRMWRIVFCLRGRKRRREHPPLNQVVMGMVAGGVRGSLCRKRLCLHIHDDTDAEKKRVGTWERPAVGRRI